MMEITQARPLAEVPGIEVYRARGSDGGLLGYGFCPDGVVTHDGRAERVRELAGGDAEALLVYVFGEPRQADAFVAGVELAAGAGVRTEPEVFCVRAERGGMHLVLCEVRETGPRTPLGPGAWVALVAPLKPLRRSEGAGVRAGSAPEEEVRHGEARG